MLLQQIKEQKRQAEATGTMDGLENELASVLGKDHCKKQMEALTSTLLGFVLSELAVFRDSLGTPPSQFYLNNLNNIPTLTHPLNATTHKHSLQANTPSHHTCQHTLSPQANLYRI